MTTHYEVRDTRPGTRLRFSCLSERDAKAYASLVYQREGVVCTIDEVTR